MMPAALPKASIRPAVLEDAAELAPLLRQADRDEVFASHGLSPEEALPLALNMSTHAWAGCLDDRVVCLFGVSPISMLTGKGSPWFLASPEIEDHQIAFLRRNRPYVRFMSHVYPLLENHVDARNRKSMKWLRWLGFNLFPAEPWGYQQLPFHRFELRK